MPILNLAIGKSKYTINCADGEEDKIIDISQKLNERVNNLSLALRSADEKTILMLCALTTEEELDNLKNDQQFFSVPPENADSINKISEKDLTEEIRKSVERELSVQIENTTNYIQNLVTRINKL